VAFFIWALTGRGRLARIAFWLILERHHRIAITKPAPARLAGADRRRALVGVHVLESTREAAGGQFRAKGADYLYPDAIQAATAA